MGALIEYRRGTASQWSAANPVLAAAEPGYETDTKKWKLGDGSTAWNTLPYLPDMAWLVANYLNVTARGSVNGVASLDGTSKVPSGQIPDLSGTYVPVTQKGAANGVPTLDATTRVPAAQMPADYALMVPRWQPNTAYALNQQVVSPTNEVVSSKSAHTSGATYTGSANWSLSSGSAALGRLFRQSQSSNSGSIGATETVIKTLDTFTFKAGRKYRVEWDTDWIGNAANCAADFMINTAAVGDSPSLTTGLTRIGLRTGQNPIASVSTNIRVTAYVEPTVDTTVQLKFTVVLTSGTTVIVQGNRAQPQQYLITDEGAQF